MIKSDNSTVFSRGCNITKATDVGSSIPTDFSAELLAINSYPVLNSLIISTSPHSSVSGPGWFVPMTTSTISHETYTRKKKGYDFITGAGLSDDDLILDSPAYEIRDSI